MGIKKAYCTYCSRQKSDDEGKIPALQRYRSQRIAQVNLRATIDGYPFYILSGSYGFIPATYPLPYYDHLLLPEEVDRMVERAARQMQDAGLETLNYYSNDPEYDPNLLPYQTVIVKTCQIVGVKLDLSYFPKTMDD